MILTNGHRLKRYEVRAADADCQISLTEADWHGLLESYLPVDADERDHRTGFAILHYALDGTYLLVSRWYGGNMLKHEAFDIDAAGNSLRLRSLHDTRIVACVWEFEVMAFERNAWVRTAMLNGGTPASLEAYLGTHFTGWV